MNVTKREILAGMVSGALLPTVALAEEKPPVTSREEIPFSVWAAINSATQAYADCIDRFDLGGLVALFSPDCVYDYAPGLMMKGRDAIAEGARKALAAVAKSSHSVGPPVVEAGEIPGTWRSRVYFTAIHEHKDGGHHTVCGRYLDLFRADSDKRMLIVHRQTISHLAEGISSSRYWLDRQPS
jgi:ketosteroid isomerase-like protein